ncbi:MAG: hypothetical protein JSR44_09495 [Spirochaetes bacterium]|nr:hypothetical protein [Spirochaetota bacterium]
MSLSGLQSGDVAYHTDLERKNLIAAVDEYNDALEKMGVSDRSWNSDWGNFAGGRLQGQKFNQEDYDKFTGLTNERKFGVDENSLRDFRRNYASRWNDLAGMVGEEEKRLYEENKKREERNKLFNDALKWGMIGFGGLLTGGLGVPALASLGTVGAVAGTALSSAAGAWALKTGYDFYNAATAEISKDAPSFNRDEANYARRLMDSVAEEKSVLDSANSFAGVGVGKGSGGSVSVDTPSALLNLTYSRLSEGMI